MTRSAQKHRERSIVEFYLQALGREGRIIGEKEPPDVLLDLDGRIIGVEVTEYHQPERTLHGFTRRQVEEAWQEIRAYVVKYRKEKRALDGLSVRLQFKDLRVPRAKEIPAFVEAVAREIENIRPKLSKERRCIRFGPNSPSILSKYLDDVTVREVGCYLEWDWNHDFGGIGTSDEELSDIIGAKLGYEPPPGVDESWLIVAGGDGISATVDFLWDDQPSTFTRLNERLADGPFEEVAILGLGWFRWTRRGGWQPIPMK